ncbi:unnamed protein product [Dibothriocephalus latus]|uniref:Uncharacterized protein n=1 Tax=Dibothriocephalus latus TaxID=60516 RepID=A0A3P7PGC0_DIBLA|nr:unnamed protein product [Dibothriocephalus latus]
MLSVFLARFLSNLDWIDDKRKAKCLQPPHLNDNGASLSASSCLEPTSPNGNVPEPKDRMVPVGPKCSLWFHYALIAYMGGIPCAGRSSLQAVIEIDSRTPAHKLTRPPEENPTRKHASCICYLPLPKYGARIDVLRCQLLPAYA